jgi:hypothetical protein
LFTALKVQNAKSNKPVIEAVMTPEKNARNELKKVARLGEPITYQALAKALNLLPPNTIHQVTITLEKLIEEDAESGLPLIASLVISKARGGLPAPGFFNCVERVGLVSPTSTSAEGKDFYNIEFDRAVSFWGA